MIDLPIVRATAKAYLQHEHWLATLGTGGVLGKVNPEPHPCAGLGADSRDVASVYYHGETEDAWWRKKMYAHGLDSFMQIPFEDGRALMDEWFEEQPHVSAGQVMKVVHMLKRAEKLGLVTARREHGRLTWKVA